MGIAIHLISAIGFGLIMPFSFAPYHLPVIGIVSIAGLVFLCENISRRRAAFYCFCYAVGMFGFGVWWIQVSVHQFGLPLYSFSVTVTAGLVLIQAALVAIFGWFGKSVIESERFILRVTALPALWVLIEFLRSWFGTGFPWLLLGYAHVESPLAGFAPIVGVYGVSFMVVMIASCLASLRHRSERLPALVVIVVVFCLGILMGNISWVKSTTGANPVVALVQAAIPQAQKWRPELREPSIEFYRNLSAAHWGKSLIIWPETAIPAFPMEVPETINALNAEAKQHNTVLLVGLPTQVVSESGEAHYYNSVQQFGDSQGRYNKRHLVPFGEYMPFDRWLRPITDMLSVPMSNFSSGVSGSTLLNAGRYHLGISICYEDAYSELVRAALPQANALVNVSNDAWFGDSIAPHQHLQIAQMRALEFGRYLLRATNTGISAIIDERGRITAASKQFLPDVVAGEFKLFDGATPYTRFGTLPVFIISLVLAGFGCWQSLKPK